MMSKTQKYPTITLDITASFEPMFAADFGKKKKIFSVDEETTKEKTDCFRKQKVKIYKV